MTTRAASVLPAPGAHHSPTFPFTVLKQGITTCWDNFLTKILPTSGSGWGFSSVPEIFLFNLIQSVHIFQSVLKLAVADTFLGIFIFKLIFNPWISRYGTWSSRKMCGSIYSRLNNSTLQERWTRAWFTIIKYRGFMPKIIFAVTLTQRKFGNTLANAKEGEI